LKRYAKLCFHLEFFLKFFQILARLLLRVWLLGLQAGFSGNCVLEVVTAIAGGTNGQPSLSAAGELLMSLKAHEY
jgi:hypothetical protein